MMFQVYSDKTATSLKSNPTNVYPVHIVVLKFIKEYRRYSIYHGHTLHGALPVSTFKNINISDEFHYEADQNVSNHASAVLLENSLPSNSQ